MIEYRQAKKTDIDEVKALQQRYHVSQIHEDDKKDGFVTTLFTDAQFEALIEKESGLFIALEDGQVIAYAMAASWDFWAEWPLFQHMIEELPGLSYKGQTLTVANSYQYGPVCIAKEKRSQGILEGLFEFHREVMKKRFPIMLTFINQANPRSYAAHTRIGLELLRKFDFSDQHYFELVYDMNQPVRRV